ncbi:MAG: BMP family protein [Acidimicrobiia bacterium]|nr:BMP family protein [Acidimicrobiia bacterium]
MKRTHGIKRLLVVFAALALVAAACGGDEEAGDAFRIAVVAPSAQNDLAFTQSIVDAVNAIQSEMGADAIEIAISDGLFVEADAAAALRGYAEDGYDLVIGHGSQYGAALSEIAQDFPDISFAWGTASDTFGLPNVSAYTAAADEGGYVHGVMASMLSASGNIGVVGPVDVGDASLYVNGFVNGAETMGSTVAVNFIGSFSDVTLATEAANAHVANGADVMTGTAQMVVGAVGVADQNNVLWFGTQSDQASLADSIVVSSQVYKWEVVLAGLVDSIKDGTLGGEVFEINLSNGGLVIEYNDAYDLPADVRQAADDAVAGIIDGSMSTGL